MRGEAFQDCTWIQPIDLEAFVLLFILEACPIFGFPGEAEQEDKEPRNTNRNFRRSGAFSIEQKKPCAYGL